MIQTWKVYCKNRYIGTFVQSNSVRESAINWLTPVYYVFMEGALSD